MANNTTNPRYWSLDTAGVIVACGTPVKVRRFVFEPAAASQVAVIQEYDPAGSLMNAHRIPAGASDASPVTINWVPSWQFNGFKLSSITGGTLYVYIE
jgi:hypothetical protein